MRRSEQVKGIYYAVAAFVMWGVVPVYFKLLESISPLEVVAHRVIWSAVLLCFVLLISKGLFSAIKIFKQPALLFGLLLSAVVIAVNWLVFIWAVGQDRIVEVTLGYFVNPLINILFGLYLFGERLRPLQWLAVTFAALGVVYQLLLAGELPWVALALALTFSAYSVLRKKIPVDAIGGLFIETLWLAPIALAYIVFLYFLRDLEFISAGFDISLLLVFSGVVTSLPLLAFAAGTRRINLSLVGILQYIGPSIAFLIAVFYYQEPMDFQRLITFLFIWAGLLIFTLEGLRHQRKQIC